MQRLQDPRIDLAEMKVHIVKKIGAERCRRYFYYLGRFLSQKLTKSEFDKFCYRLLGRENLALHNKLVRSILRNASLAKPPPPVHEGNDTEKSGVLGQEDGAEQSGSMIPNHSKNGYVWSNGVLPKVRLGTCDKTIKDRNRSTENGDFGSFACQISSRNSDERSSALLILAEKVIPNKGQAEAPFSSRSDEAQEKPSRLILSTSSVMAPLGISFSAASVDGARRTAPLSARADFISCYDSGGLAETEMLRKRMENIAVAHGLGGVSSECSSMLNNMLDVYLRKLIKASVDLAGARSTNGTHGKQSLHNLQRRDDSVHIQTSNQPFNITREQHPVSLLDFRVAMELTPHQLGQDWPLLREKILTCSFEEREEV
ncbi:unnamed protein product [Cochlearia groenlandica]